jgi:hypothetical protein
MTTTTLHLTQSDLCVLLCGIAAAQAEALDDEFNATTDVELRAAQATGEILSAMYYRLHNAEHALRIRTGPAEDPAFAAALDGEQYPPGKVRPPRAWPAPTHSTTGAKL